MACRLPRRPWGRSSPRTVCPTKKEPSGRRSPSRAPSSTASTSPAAVRGISREGETQMKELVSGARAEANCFVYYSSAALSNSTSTSTPPTTQNSSKSRVHAPLRVPRRAQGQHRLFSHRVHEAERDRGRGGGRSVLCFLLFSPFRTKRKTKKNEKKLIAFFSFPFPKTLFQKQKNTIENK